MTGATFPNRSEEIRLDPADLPARWSYPLPAAERGGQQASVYMDGGGIVMKRRLSGLPLTLSLSFASFEGVAVRLGADGTGGLLASVELHHPDPALTVPLTVTHDMEAAAEDWRRWADQLGLPMLLISGDAPPERVDVAAPISAGRPVPRRGNAAVAARRPRFLARRKPGAAGPMPVLEGWREIISYE